MDSSQIIDALGGTDKVATICEITPSAVSQWRNNGIPRPWLRYLNLLYPRVVRKSAGGKLEAK